MATMDEYIEQLLAEIYPDNPTLHDVVQNILDEPISDSVKARLLKPLQPGKYRPSPPPRVAKQRAKERKRKALEEEFDPILAQVPHKSLRSAVVAKQQEQYLDDILDFSFDKKEAKTDELVFKQTPWALGNFLRGWQMDVPKGHPQGADPRAFLEDAELLIQKKLEEELKALKGGLKFQLALKVDLEKANPDGSEQYTDPVLRHKQEAVLQKSEIKAALHQAIPRVQETLEKWTQRGSGWAVDQVHTLWLDIARYQPLRGGSYIPLPAAVKNKKAVVNVKNKDDHCLRWALRAALFQVAKDPQRPTKYPTEDGLDFTGIDAPTPISQIPKVEWQNDLAINVFGWDKGVIVHHISNQPEDMPRTNLLLIEKAGKFHYTWIKNLSRLLYDQSKHREKKHFCERCLHGYSREDLLENHKPECQGIGQTAVRVEMPEEGKNKLTFQNHHKQLPAPYIIYADFEALTTKVEGPELDPTKSNTQRTQQHEACSYCYIVVRCDGQTEKPVEYRGPNAAEHLLRALKDEESKIKGVLANKKAMRMTREDWRVYNTATKCHVCDLPLLRAQHRDATDLYDVTSGLYRGLAHRKCAYDDYERRRRREAALRAEGLPSPPRYTVADVFCDGDDIDLPEPGLVASQPLPARRESFRSARPRGGEVCYTVADVFCDGDDIDLPEPGLVASQPLPARRESFRSARPRGGEVCYTVADVFCDGDDIDLPEPGLVASQPLPARRESFRSARPRGGEVCYTVADVFCDGDDIDLPEPGLVASQPLPARRESFRSARPRGGEVCYTVADVFCDGDDIDLPEPGLVASQPLPARRESFRSARPRGGEVCYTVADVFCDGDDIDLPEPGLVASQPLPARRESFRPSPARGAQIPPVGVDGLDIDAAKEQQDCLVCQESLIREQFVDAVRDHCHITGRFRGAAHNACNLKLRLNPKTTSIPVVFHNLRGYDSHLLMQAISKIKPPEDEGEELTDRQELEKYLQEERDYKLSCIPNNTEKYISFSLGQLRFIDSAQFLLASLAKLVAANSPEAFQITARYEPDRQKRQLLLRKGVYPYEFMDSWERFEAAQLPPKEAFYSKLSDEHISDSDYAHAQQVWKTFECRTLGDYTDLYSRTDVLLLADVFENFRKTCQKQYGLDPAHYYTSPGLSWDALLKKTRVELELLTDYDQHLFIEKGVRGGISMVSKRHARANNPAVEGYDPEKPNSHILYLDANNLYGWAMSQPLPTGGFQWVEDCDRLADSVKNLPADGAEGYILEVDLEYPQGLHDEHNSYPLAPERMVVQKEWMSDYQQELLGVGVAPTEVEKLVPNLRDKERYVLHYRNLQLYLSLGMRVKKVHRALRFEQSPWMELYIRMNTELRKVATSDFEKDLYKLMNNAVFGKTMENLRRRVNVKLVRAHEEDKLRRLIASPSFARANIFDNDLAAVQMHKSRLVLNRPVYVGMSVLDLSKSLMYDFYYNQMKAQYGDRVELLYTDTDSLLLEIQTEDVYSDMSEHQSLYDTSDYPEDHPLHSKVNKKVLGKMKDECAGRAIEEYVGLRPKMYSILEASGACIKKAKGVKKNVVKKHIRHEQYREALFGKKTFRHSMDVLRSEKHHIYGLHLNKVSLSPFDSKRWIAENGVDTLAYGHKDAQPAGAAEMDAYIDELLSDVWESHQEAAACQKVPPEAPLGRIHVVEHYRPANSRARARRAWWQIDQADTPEETIWRQWLSCAALLPALQADKESEHRRWRGVLPPWGRSVDGGPLKRDFVPLIEPLWHLLAACQSALSPHHSGQQWPQGAFSPTPATAHLGSSAVLVPADARIAVQPRCGWSVPRRPGPCECPHDHA